MVFQSDRSWAEINFNHLLHNYAQIRGLLEAQKPLRPVKMMGIVKGNAYGHGSVAISRLFERTGLDYLGVATLDEAIELRSAGIAMPIIVLGYVDPKRSAQIIGYGLTQTIYQEETAEALSEAAVRMRKQVKIHIKVDTGMMRIGVDWKDERDLILRIARMRGLVLEGLYTHMCADAVLDDTFTQVQFERYMELLRWLSINGLDVPIKHVCNSPTAMRHPHMHLDMVRCGYSLYGCYTAPRDGAYVNLLRVMTLKAQIIRVNQVKEGVGISYDKQFTTAHASRIVTIPLGFADGFMHMVEGAPEVLVNGQAAPVVGAVCMDFCMADVTDIDGAVAVGDVVELCPNSTAKGRLTFYTNPTLLGRRVPRYYFEDEKLTGSENYLLSAKDCQFI